MVHATRPVLRRPPLLLLSVIGALAVLAIPMVALLA